MCPSDLSKEPFVLDSTVNNVKTHPSPSFFFVEREKSSEVNKNIKKRTEVNVIDYLSFISYLQVTYFLFRHDYSYKTSAHTDTKIIRS